MKSSKKIILTIIIIVASLFFISIVVNAGTRITIPARVIYTPNGTSIDIPPVDGEEFSSSEIESYRWRVHLK